ncbi:NmrA-like protein [Mycena rosella]|uniref:NmrA-like protein n=1 Tax=Mycena rosella TaxID=1033263 RepID=A0AAD7CU08_MYCRO|nr:NmrA-like protein [Mycena rosella]
MRITWDPSAPLVDVDGATGMQGGSSLINRCYNIFRSYLACCNRIHGFTRDTTKPAAQQLVAKGVEVVIIQLIIDNKEVVFKAFVGANMVFLVTDFWEQITLEKEVSEGMMFIDAIKAAGVDRLVRLSKASTGKYVHVIHFNGKVDVTEYRRQSGVPFVDVQAGLYPNNFLHNTTMLAKQEDGTFTIEWPL